MRSFSGVRPTLGLLLVLAVAPLLAAEASVPAVQTPLAAAQAQYWKTPYDPAAINALALRLVEVGDASTARLLWYRAVRIAPDREDIRANLARLEAGSRRVGGAVPAEAVTAVQAGGSASKPSARHLTDELPPLWPLPTPPH
ncbi:hypothetical protein OL229_13245 [Neisseriaceae bacterium JH1-16]|nr:hypothetical protein [Neisseriaceae bacterium JH1-16]